MLFFVRQWRRKMAFRRRRPYKRDSFGEAKIPDCKVLAVYLYNAVLLDTEFDDNDVIANSVTLFFKLAEKFKVMDSVNEFFNKTIEHLEKTELLSIDPDFVPSPDLTFDYSDVPYKYREDKTLDRRLPGCLRNVSEAEVNFFRILHFGKIENFFPKLIANFLIRKTPSQDFTLLEEVPSAISKNQKNTEVLDFVSKPADLSEAEAEFLTMSYRIQTCTYLRELFSNYSNQKTHDMFAEMLHMTKKSYQGMISKESKLYSFGFIGDAGFIDDDFIECISAASLKPFFIDLLKNEDSKNFYPEDSFNVSKDACTIMNKMLSGNEPVSLMLYGKPGSGKTEFAKTLAKQSGNSVYVFKNESELNRDSNTNILCRLNCLLALENKNSVIIIDEADTLLKTRDASFLGMLTPSKNKGTVNKMLENNKNKIIWIVNFTSQIDESTLRRFTFSYRFEAMSREQLRAIATTKISTLGLEDSTCSQILDLMDKYRVTGASVDNVVKTIKSLGGKDSDQRELVDCVQSVLKENSALINGKSKMRESVNKNYDISILNASMSPDHIVKMIRNAEKFSEKNRSTENGIRMLFYGQSGTGKTEFARYISEQLGRKILLKRASDILDKYVGGTEENIREAFDEADRTDSILLFDEADSFFASRDSADHSWERTQVNEFLTQMEEFPGILICTTNLRKIMDSAMNRRFHMIVEFKPLDREGIEKLCTKYFPFVTFTENQLRSLECTESMTAGDFGTLASRIRFMDESERNSDYITNELLKMQDEKEEGSGHRRIGF